jgi:hypothetical protein
METSVSRGITILKRGQRVMDFVQGFMTGRGIGTYTLHQRTADTWATSPMMFLNEQPKRVITYTFTEFAFDDLGFHAKDLTAAELERDITPLQKYIYKDAA